MSYVKNEELKKTLIFILEYKTKDKNEEISCKEIETLKGERIEYSEVAKFIENLDDGQRTILMVAAKEIREKYKGDESREVILKVLDYIALEVPRYRLYDKLEHQAEKSDRITRNLKYELEKKEEQLLDYEQKLERLQNEYVGILGIFTSVIFALFGGLNILSEVFRGIESFSDVNNLLGTLILGAFTTLVVVNILYMLLYGIGRFLNKALISKECPNNCPKNKISDKFICWLLRHKGIVGINFIIMVFLFVIMFLFISNY